VAKVAANGDSDSDASDVPANLNGTLPPHVGNPAPPTFCKSCKRNVDLEA
jgi:hypothetical protein